MMINEELKFKFKYWDSKTEQFLTPYIHSVCCENGKEVPLYVVCVSGEGWISLVDVDKKPDRFKKHFSTGFFDKNLNPVYDYHIIQYVYDDTTHKTNGEDVETLNPRFNRLFAVKWVDYQWMLLNYDNVNKANYNHYGKHCFDCSFGALGLQERVLVVGNIYENAKLLEAKECVQ